MRVCNLMFAAVAVSCALWGGDPIKAKDMKAKALPKEVAAKLQQGFDSECFSWTWKSPDFEPQGGFRLVGFKIQSEDRNGDLFDQLRRRLDMEGDPSSGNELHLVIVDYWPGLGTDDRWLDVEGQVKRGGKVVAAFLTRNSRPKGQGALGMAEDFMRDLTTFLRK